MATTNNRRLPPALLTALGSLLIALALGPLFQHLLPNWAKLLTLGCALGLWSLQYLAAVEGNVRPYLTHAQLLGLGAGLGGVAAAYYGGPLAGIAVAITLGTSALLFLWSFQPLLYAQGCASFVILLLALSSIHNTDAVGYFVAYSLLFAWLLLVHKHQGPLTWRDTSAQVACLLILAVTTGLVYALLPRWPLGAHLPHQADEPVYSDANWDAKAKDLRDGRLPVEILPSIQQQFLLGAQSANPKTLADYAYQAAAPSASFTYSPLGNSFELNNFASRMAWLDAPIMQVVAASPMNLRAKIFDEFDGIRWHNSAVALYKTPLQYGQLLWRSDTGQGNPVRFKVTLLTPIGTAIPITGQLDQLYFPATSIGFDVYGLLQSPATSRPDTRYFAQVHNIGLGQRTIGDPNHLQHPNYLQLPSNLDPRVTTLASEITAKTTGQLQQAELLEAYFRHKYRYHFDAVAASVGVIPVTEFLFETQRGTSEYFATSLTLMLRSLGIPARLVSGFAVQRRNPFTGDFDVLGADAHAWVEAYVDNKGWIELEPMALYRQPLQVQPAVFGLTQLQQWRRQQAELNALYRDRPVGLWSWTVYFAFWQVLLLGLGFGIKVLATEALLPWLKQHPRYLNWRKNRLIRHCGRQRNAEDPAAAPIHCLVKLAAMTGQPLAPGLPIEDWAKQWQRAVPEFDPRAFATAFNHYHFGLNVQGDLVGQCQTLLAQLETLRWEDIVAGLSPPKTQPDAE